MISTERKRAIVAGFPRFSDVRSLFFPLSPLFVEFSDIFARFSFIVVRSFAEVFRVIALQKARAHGHDGGPRTFLASLRFSFVTFRLELRPSAAKQKRFLEKLYISAAIALLAIAVLILKCFYKTSANVSSFAAAIAAPTISLPFKFCFYEAASAS